jgi:aspartate-semialdehyde dehydrogenase
MSVRLAVVGATGAVGSLVLKLLAERNFPFSHLKLCSLGSRAGDCGGR